MQSPADKPRRSSLSSNKSFHSIDEFKYQSPFQQYSRSHKFPFRPTINILLIILTTLQVFLLINSRIYLRGELVRSFLSVYVDKERYPGLFEGREFYLDVVNVNQLREHFIYFWKKVQIIEEDGFVDLFYKDAKFILHTEYIEFAGSEHRKNVHIIDPKVGIVEPFNMHNITDIQLYLLQISQFQIQIQNLTMRQNWEGFSQRYEHDITYTFVDNIKVQVNFDFKISNAMVRPDDNHDNIEGMGKKEKIDRGKGEGRPNIRMTDCVRKGCYHQDGPFGEPTYRTEYIVKVRIFYGIVLLLSLVSLYLNYHSIRKTYKVLYEQLGKLQQEHQTLQQPHSHHAQPPSPASPVTSEQPQNPLFSQQQQNQIRHDVHKWVQSNKLTISQIKVQHYFHILEFDIIFSTLSNVFETITAFYLVSGIERERMAGITCLFSWMTIFKLVRNYKKLVLMYQLIKLSIAKVTSFFVQFLPVFIAYALLGLCLFPKVSFFSSLANSVSTLICLMMGDSIQMITNAILEKNAVLTAIIYIFSFVLLFMHAIHNTLTSLIKEFFIIKKIELVKYEKARLHQNNYLYIEELKTNTEKEKQKLPLKLTDQLVRSLLRIKALNRTKKYEESCIVLFHEIDNIRITEKWMIMEDELEQFAKVREELTRRASVIGKVKEEFEVDDASKARSSQKLDDSNKQSLLTQI